MTDDEFRFLPGDAAMVCREGPLPEVRRVQAVLGDGRIVSGLSFRPELPPRLVLLHGAGLNAHSFDRMLLALDTDEHPVPALSLDLPGHGRSDWRPEADYLPERLASDIAEALDALAPAPIALLGHSLGGMTAAIVAAARPELVDRMIVVDITPGVSPQRAAGSVSDFITGQRDFADVEEIIDRAIRFGIGTDRSSLARGISLNTRVRPDGRLEWTHHFAHLDALPGTGADADSGRSADAADPQAAARRPADPLPFAPIWDVLAALGAPVGLIAASRGMVDDRLRREWTERLPGSTVASVEGPHNLHEAAPAELARAVERMLAAGR